MTKVEEKSWKKFPEYSSEQRAMREGFVDGYKQAIEDVTDILLKKLLKKNSLESTTICRTIKLYLR